VIVVSDTSPITSLGKISRLDLLRTLYHSITIPTAVDLELRRGQIVVPDWIEVRSPADRALVARLEADLDSGEAEALAVALEAGADLVLIDEKRGRDVARRLGLRFVGLLGVVLDAKRQGHLRAVRPLLDELAATAGFWIRDDLRREILEKAGEA
jgi:predicted nucleic acid-binding protein